MKLRANALHQTGRQRHSVIDRQQVERRRFAHLAARRSFSRVASRCFQIEPLGRGLQPMNGKRHFSGSRLSRRMSGRIFVSVASGRRRPCLGATRRQIKKRAPAPLIHGPSLMGLSITSNAPKCRFSRRPFLRSFGRVVDFGGLKELRAILEGTFDHKTVVAADDPELAWFREAA